MLPLGDALDSCGALLLGIGTQVVKKGWLVSRVAAILVNDVFGSNFADT